MGQDVAIGMGAQIGGAEGHQVEAAGRTKGAVLVIIIRIGRVVDKSVLCFVVGELIISVSALLQRRFGIREGRRTPDPLQFPKLFSVADQSLFFFGKGCVGIIGSSSCQRRLTKDGFIAFPILRFLAGDQRFFHGCGIGELLDQGNDRLYRFPGDGFQWNLFLRDLCHNLKIRNLFERIRCTGKQAIAQNPGIRQHQFIQSNIILLGISLDDGDRSIQIFRPHQRGTHCLRLILLLEKDQVPFLRRVEFRCAVEPLLLQRSDPFGAIFRQGKYFFRNLRICHAKCGKGNVPILIRRISPLSVTGIAVNGSFFINDVISFALPVSHLGVRDSQHILPICARQGHIGKGFLPIFRGFKVCRRICRRQRFLRFGNFQIFFRYLGIALCFMGMLGKFTDQNSAFGWIKKLRSDPFGLITFCAVGVGFHPTDSLCLQGDGRQDQRICGAKDDHCGHGAEHLGPTLLFSLFRNQLCCSGQQCPFHSPPSFSQRLDALLCNRAKAFQRPDPEQNLSNDLVLRYAANRLIARVNGNAAVVSQHKKLIFRNLIGQFDRDLSVICLGQIRFLQHFAIAKYTAVRFHADLITRKTNDPFDQHFVVIIKRDHIAALHGIVFHGKDDLSIVQRRRHG